MSREKFMSSLISFLDSKWSLKEPLKVDYLDFTLKTRNDQAIARSAANFHTQMR